MTWRCSVELELSPDQVAALHDVLDWRERPSKPYLVLGGYAGTGKTTLVSHLAGEWDGVAICALCGTAAQVLRDKGAAASTIHGLIYIPVRDGRGRTRFCRRRFLDARTIIVDEASMIDHVLLQDLLAFRIPVLFVGDHGQLEPIGTTPNLM